jgi:uncharacterized protein YndB with AHSA1/START domain
MESQVSSKPMVITRTFDAPRELVWQAWTDPQLFMRWWGPSAFTCPVCRMDVRVGGKYLWCMRSPEGQEFWTAGEFREVVAPERLVYTDNFADEHGNPVPASHYGMSDDFPMETVVTVTLAEQGGKTVMTLAHAGMPQGPESEGASAGWNESFDKLAKALAEESASR